MRATLTVLLCGGTLTSAYGQIAAPSVPSDGPALRLGDAIRLTLRGHPDIAAAEAEVDARSADLLGARSVLDTIGNARLGHRQFQSTVLPSERLRMEDRRHENTTSLDLGAVATLPWGTQISPGVGITRRDLRFSPEMAVGGMALPPSQRANVDVTLAQPLLRGRGEIGTLSGVAGAERDREAAGHLRNFIAQRAAFGTIAAYWRLVAALDQIGILTESEARSRKLLEETRMLVKGNQRPAADLVQIEAHLLNRTRAVIDAHRARRQALHDLRLAMGLAAEGDTPDWRPIEALPRPAVLTSPGQASARAISSRSDLHAAGQSVKAAEALVLGAGRNALPALDLRLSLGYEGATDKDGPAHFITALGANPAGLNAGASLTLELPIRNDARRADRDRKSAELRRRLTARDDLARQVNVQVYSALDELRLSADALAAAEQAVARYQRVIEDEQTKLRAGLSTIIDVVVTQDQLTQAQLALSGSRLDYAVVLARLRFETGDLPSTEDELGARLHLVIDAAAAGAADGGK